MSERGIPMQQHPPRIGEPQLAAPAFASTGLSSLLRSAIDRLVHRLAPRHAGEPLNHFEHNRQLELEQRLNAVKQALEVFRLYAELRRRTAPGLGRWLAARA